MLRHAALLLRRGQPNPPLVSNRRNRVPVAHKPFQGGQQHFQPLLLQRANAMAAKASAQKQHSQLISSSVSDSAAAASASSSSPGAANRSADPSVQFGEQNVLFSRDRRRAYGTAAAAAQDDGFVDQRTFNELDFYERVQRESRSRYLERLQQKGGANRQPQQDGEEEEEQGGAAAVAASAPPIITSDAEFRAAHGFSLLKESMATSGAAAAGVFPQQTSYASLDLWSEMPQYGANVYFLYLIARRRNAYAVLYDYKGKRVMPVYSVGNRGLKESDKGFQSEGSADNAHQVTSQYLSDVLPKLREKELAAGRSMTEKIDVVVRVLGFYNGRQGAIRAVMDHSDAFNVRYVEDVTPFPLNGPKMPRARVKVRVK